MVEKVVDHLDPRARVRAQKRQERTTPGRTQREKTAPGVVVADALTVDPRPCVFVVEVVGTGESRQESPERETRSPEPTPDPLPPVSGPDPAIPPKAPLFKRRPWFELK